MASGFQPTSEELDRIQEAFKNEEFRKLFMEYAEEISSEENRRKMEEELQMLERQNGRDVEFMRPDPCFCIKIKTKDSVGQSKKIFVNICQSDKVDTAKANGSNDNGASWDIPHKFSPARTCLDKSGNESIEHDVTFHSSTMLLAQKSSAFKTAIIDSALETLQQTFQYKFKRNDYRILINVKSKGTPATLVVGRSSAVQSDSTSSSINTLKKMGKEKAPMISEIDSIPSDAITNSVKEEIAEYPKEPKYKISYRDIVDLKNLAGKDKTTPEQELVIRIELNEIESGKDLEVDVNSKLLKLRYRNVYALDLNLPVQVEVDKHGESTGKNKCLYHAEKKQLEMILKIKPKQAH